MHATLRRGIGTTLLCAPLFALAHHAEGYAPPATIAASLLSGLAHPAIEIGQVAFLIALGAVCARWPQGAAVIARFVAGSALGVLLAALGAIAPAEPLLPLALLGVAAVLAWRGDRIGTGPAGAAVASAATALAGLVHGQAAVEPAIGAAAGAFLAYASAMLVAQVAIVLLARTVLAAALPADPAIRRRTWNAVAAGSAVAAVAVAVQPGLALL